MIGSSHKWPVLTWILLFLSLSCEAAGVNPGLKIRITQNGLDYAASQAINSLDVRGQRLPDFSGSDHLFIGKVDYEITGAYVSSFVSPKSRLTVRSGQGVHWSVTGCSAQLQGNWGYHYKALFPIRDHGTFSIDLTNAGIELDFLFGKDTQGRPTVKVTGCSANIQQVKVHLHGGASWLYKIFDHAINRAISKNMIKTLCSEAEKAINVSGNKALAKIKVVLPIRGTGVLDYSLLEPPIFATGYIDSLHKGEIFNGDREEAPYAPAPFLESRDRSKMAYVWLSDYLLNTAGWVLHKQNILQFFLTPGDLNEKSRHILNTTCPNSECIGNIITALQDKFPDSTVSVNMSTSKPPTLEISPDKIMGHFEGDIVFFVNFPNRTTEFILATHVLANVSLVLGVTGRNITAKVTEITPAITISDTRIGGVSGKGLTWMFQNILFNTFVIPMFNKIGEEGLALPETRQISYVNPTIQLQENAVLLATDLKWIPDLDIKKLQLKKRLHLQNEVLRKL